MSSGPGPGAGTIRTAINFLSARIAAIFRDRPPCPADLLPAAAALACIYIARIVQCVIRKGDRRYPRFAPGSMWDHMRSAMHPLYPWWLLVSIRQQ